MGRDLRRHARRANRPRNEGLTHISEILAELGFLGGLEREALVEAERHGPISPAPYVRHSVGSAPFSTSSSASGGGSARERSRGTRDARHALPETVGAAAGSALLAKDSRASGHGVRSAGKTPARHGLAWGWNRGSHPLGAWRRPFGAPLLAMAALAAGCPGQRGRRGPRPTLSRRDPGRSEMTATKSEAG